MVELAKIQVYSSNTLPPMPNAAALGRSFRVIDQKSDRTDQCRLLATRAFVLNWNANPILAGSVRLTSKTKLRFRSADGFAIGW